MAKREPLAPVIARVRVSGEGLTGVTTGDDSFGAMVTTVIVCGSPL